MRIWQVAFSWLSSAVAGRSTADVSESMVKAVQELLKPFVCYLPYRARFEIRHLNHAENAETLLPVVKLDVGKFIEGDISVFILLHTDNDAEKTFVVVLLASFKNEPPDIRDGEYCHADSVLFLIVLGMYRITLNCFLKLGC